MRITAKAIVHGAASGEVLYSSTPLSFWGGVGQDTGEIIDHHHPLFGENIKDRVLVLPSTRGSCTGSLVMIELLVNKLAPAALVFRDAEEIATTGVLVAQTLLSLSIPVYRVSAEQFNTLRSQKYISTWSSHGPDLQGSQTPPPPQPEDSPPPQLPDPDITNHISLTPTDKAILTGANGTAASLAMQILLQYANLQNAHQLTPVSRAHIDACIYTGPASNLVAQTFLKQGARVAVPTTLNSISIDQQRWRELGVDEDLAREANRLASSYIAMGATNSFTCAPYLLGDSVPQTGESIGWAESNAVVFANSVLGARTQKYPDLIDVCIALTGRAPLAGAQTAQGRVPASCIEVDVRPERVVAMEDAFWPLLGYAVGKVVGGGIPLITGLEGMKSKVTMADLKGFGAAFATTASAPMFHIAGVTPEAAQFYPAGLPRIRLTETNLRAALDGLTTASDKTVGLISLGNPHFSLEEFARLSELCDGKRKVSSVQMMITTNREVYGHACTAGYTKILEAFGAEIVTDTCWCMISESAIKADVVNLMTNSAKYAHYAPGIVHRGVHFGSLKDCVTAAEMGRVEDLMVT
ncbi:hypothetical protein ASPVEDRAFT_55075 [Aspergillus versicolor CBS 583.65]|uniref:Aconitase X catalytic domain-containing protein n=1 Tax=Aspergillus versicolor CBS 583.65 TaxID=1036611 RepID=A0A1L9PUF0_ASPVE|nr:uncharacterized protein ASPVEDRAFT_55075 [Aspergillus versicolor CBS 583.65]OJJ05045.1 hypothetical protein ASPVEDRAFT_55075 [Aspergillus versicolor CBS 583.65]